MNAAPVDTNTMNCMAESQTMVMEYVLGLLCRCMLGKVDFLYPIFGLAALKHCLRLVRTVQGPPSF